MKRYIVFERVNGSKCWTVAMKESSHKRTAYPPLMLPAEFHKRETADEFIREVQSKKLGFWGGIPDQRKFESCIIEADLPE